MKPYLIQVDKSEDLKLLQRLQDSIEVNLLTLQEINQKNLHDHYLIVPGEILPKFDKNVQEILLRQQVDLLFIPPFSTNKLDGLFTLPSEVHLKSDTFSSIKVDDEAFQSLINREALNIFFQKVIYAKPSRTLLRTASGESVLVYTQARSTWGRLLITTLMLTSLSARSNETHKKLFWDGLSRWLVTTSPTPIQSHEVSKQKTPSEEIQLPVLLMAVEIARKDNIMLEDDLHQAIKLVQGKLHQENAEIYICDATKPLLDLGILQINEKGGWNINLAQLFEKINQMHLTSYIRRMQ